MRCRCWYLRFTLPFPFLVSEWGGGVVGMRGGGGSASQHCGPSFAARAAACVAVALVRRGRMRGHGAVRAGQGRGGAPVPELVARQAESRGVCGSVQRPCSPPLAEGRRLLPAWTASRGGVPAPGRLGRAPGPAWGSARGRGRPSPTRSRRFRRGWPCGRSRAIRAAGMRLGAGIWPIPPRRTNSHQVRLWRALTGAKSTPPEPCSDILSAPRAPWPIANGLPWGLDGTRNEDRRRHRNHHGPATRALLRRRARNLARRRLLRRPARTTQTRRLERRLPTQRDPGSRMNAQKRLPWGTRPPGRLRPRISAREITAIFSTRFSQLHSLLLTVGADAGLGSVVHIEKYRKAFEASHRGYIAQLKGPSDRD